MDENPYKSPQAEAKPARKSVPTWRIVVGGLILFLILGPFFMIVILPLIVALLAPLLPTWF
jgi:hypothetical protein